MLNLSLSLYFSCYKIIFTAMHVSLTQFSWTIQEQQAHKHRQWSDNHHTEVECSRIGEQGTWIVT